MIWGPIYPMSRDGLWNLLRGQPERIERGLRVVLEHLDLGTGDLGVVDALLRDAAGNPVLLLVTDANDAALLARVVAAHSFWRRNQHGLTRALPEAELRSAAAFRTLVVASNLPADTAEALSRLALERLELLEVERFQIGKEERIVVRNRRWDVVPDRSEAEPLDAHIDEKGRELLALLAAQLVRLDSRIRIDGDRFSRRASCDGRELCLAWYEAGVVQVSAPELPVAVLATNDDVRHLLDALARRHLAQLRNPPSAVPVREAAAAPATAPAADGDRRSFDHLRASLSLAQLSREEWTALGEALPEESPRQGG